VGSNRRAGFYRDGCCSTGPEDLGRQSICAVVTAEFLEHQRSIGNDLSMPHYRFPGLVPGDRWCVTTGSGPTAKAAPLRVVPPTSAPSTWCPWGCSGSTPSTCPDDLGNF
jgi:uncharacterized protein (DUF2237 family)